MIRRKVVLPTITPHGYALRDCRCTQNENELCVITLKNCNLDLDFYFRPARSLLEGSSINSMSTRLLPDGKHIQMEVKDGTPH